MLCGISSQRHRSLHEVGGGFRDDGVARGDGIPGRSVQTADPAQVLQYRTLSGQPGLHGGYQRLDRRLCLEPFLGGVAGILEPGVELGDDVLSDRVEPVPRVGPFFVQGADV